MSNKKFIESTEQDWFDEQPKITIQKQEKKDVEKPEPVKEKIEQKRAPVIKYSL